MIAFLQAKWTALSAEEKLTYEMLSSELDKELNEDSSKSKDRILKKRSREYQEDSEDE